MDSYYSYEYGHLFAKQENGTLFAAYYEDNDCKIFYPFIVRKVPNVNLTLYDIVTPYGYGGPILEGKSKSFEEFYALFCSYCHSKDIITETIRFHPFYKNYRFCSQVMDIEYIRKTTAVDLTKQLHEIRESYTDANKRNIKKATKNNLTCFIATPTKENIDIFIKMYKETMDRNTASEFYYFSDEYFYEQVKPTDISETLLLFSQLDNEVIAGAMVIIGQEYAHYHLGASKTRFLEYRPNNLLFDFMIEVCKFKGAKKLHLGGGYQENDGLFKYKASFTDHHHFDYYIGKKIHNEETYDQVMKYLNSFYELEGNYFPSYRGKMKRKVLQ